MGRKKKEVVEKEIEQVAQVVLPTEKEQLEVRRDELSTHREWMVVNKLQDIGQVEVALAKTIQRLNEL